MTFENPSEVRPSFIAGAWYPGRQPQLEATVDSLLAQVKVPRLPGRLMGLIAPHAGYQYSGAIAAHAYAQLTGRTFGSVIILGPDHAGASGLYGVSTFKYYQTPLGPVEIDRELLDELDRLVALDHVDDEREHSLEIQLPFLQRTLKSFRVLPIMMGYPLAPHSHREGWQACQTLSKALTRLLETRDDVLLVASSDLAHQYDYRETVRYDRAFVDLLRTYNADRLAQGLMAGQCQACGGVPIVTMLMATRTLGGRGISVLTHANSGDVTGDKQPGHYTVGYLAAAVYGPPSRD